MIAAQLDGTPGVPRDDRQSVDLSEPHPIARGDIAWLGHPCMRVDRAVGCAVKDRLERQIALGRMGMTSLMHLINLVPASTREELQHLGNQRLVSFVEEV